MLAESSESLFDKAVLQSTPLGVRLMDRDPMIHVLSQEADKRLVQDTLTRKTEEMLPLQMELITAATPYSSRPVAFAPSLGHSPLPVFSNLLKRSGSRPTDTNHAWLHKILGPKY